MYVQSEFAERAQVPLCAATRPQGPRKRAHWRIHTHGGHEIEQSAFAERAQVPICAATRPRGIPQRKHPADGGNREREQKTESEFAERAQAPICAATRPRRGPQRKQFRFYSRGRGGEDAQGMKNAHQPPVMRTKQMRAVFHKCAPKQMSLLLVPSRPILPSLPVRGGRRFLSGRFL